MQMSTVFVKSSSHRKFDCLQHLIDILLFRDVTSFTLDIKGPVDTYPDLFENTSFLSVLG